MKRVKDPGGDSVVDLVETFSICVNELLLLKFAFTGEWTGLLLKFPGVWGCGSGGIFLLGFLCFFLYRLGRQGV